MARASKKSPDEKLRVVLSVLRGRSRRAKRPVGRGCRSGRSKTGRGSSWSRAAMGWPRGGNAGRPANSSSKPITRNSRRLWVKPMSSCGSGAGGGVSPSFGDLEMIRTEAGMPISRFCELIDLPRRTYHYSAGPLPGRGTGEGAVAATGGGPHRTRRGQVRDQLGRLGSPQGLGPHAPRRPRGRLGVIGAQGYGPPGAVAAGGLPGRAPPARRSPAGGVRRPAPPTQPGLADGLHRIRNHQWRDLAPRRRGRLVRQARSGLPDCDHPDRL